MDMEIPIFRICRGQQILNVAMDGTLFIDIATDYDTKIKHRQPNTYNCFHDVYIEPGTKLGWATATIKGNN